ncbi:MAG: 1-acyl-sn-glycerol-3-phosphate acyltransferase [Chloroflexi bacterium]|nr:1-acyl-sn-glycerol-3-phosphate acyltransferase [Chloroflexota bacterium]
MTPTFTSSAVLEQKRSPFYWIATWTVKFLTHVLCRIDDTELARVPEHGPFLVVVNHVNFLEGPILYTHLLPRKMTGFVKAENLEHLFFGTLLFTLWKGIPLYRDDGGDMAAFRLGLQALKEGQFLTVAPEGSRSGHGRLRQGYPGIAFLALRSKVPVLPIAVHGGEVFWDNFSRLRRTDFHIAVGQSFRLDTGGVRATGQVRQQMIDEIMYQMAALLPPAYRGFYSDLSAATETYLSFPSGTESNLCRA